MKITIISPASPYKGGISNFTKMMYGELVINNQVEIINFKRQYPTFLFPGKSQFEEFEPIIKVPSRRLIDSINPLNWKKVGESLKKEKPDILIVCYWMPFFAPALGFISRIVKQNRHTKIIALCHNIFPHEKRFFDKALTSYFLNSMNYFITLSDSVKKELLKLKKDALCNTLFVPVFSCFGHAVEKEVAKKKLKISSDKTILFFGFIREYKGLDVLLAAAALIKKEFNFRLLIVGEFYSDEQKYKSMIKFLDLENEIVLLDKFVPDEDVKYCFSASDVVVLPYKTATQSGIAMMAKNFQKPVIASKVGGLPEIINDGVTGFLTEPNDPEKLAEAILKFYSQNCEDDFSKNIIEELNDFSWNKFASGLMNFIKQIS